MEQMTWNLCRDATMRRTIPTAPHARSTKTKNGARLLADLADLVDQWQTTGTVSYTAVAKKYGYSRQAASQQVKDLLLTEPMLELAKALRR